MNDRPLTDWAPTNWAAPVSINAVISAIAVVSRATLAMPIIACINQLKWVYFKRPHKVSDMETFDSASRGGMGSVKFLFKIPMNGAAIGALVTLLAYFLGPFYQQVIRLEQREIFVSGNETAAAFSFAHEYFTNVSLNAATGTTIPHSIDSRMQGAMIAGVFGNNISSTFSCPSACRWPGPIITLGFHSECRNITVRTLATKRCQDRITGEEVDNSAKVSNNCTLVTPNGIKLVSDYTRTSNWTGYYLTGKTIPFPLVDAPMIEESSFKEPNFTLSANIFTAVQYKINRPSDVDEMIRGEDIHECTISVAAYNYSDIQSSGNELWIGRRDIISSQLSIRSVNANESDSLRRNETFVYSAPGIPDLSIKRLDLESIAGFLRDEFTDIVIEDGVDPEQTFGVSVSLASRNLTESFAGMTEQMTRHIALGDKQQVQAGNVVQTIVFVVAWYHMLILPIFVTTATLFLLMFTIWRSRASTGAVLWKSSALALLFHHITPSDDPVARGAALRCDFADPKDLQRAAKNMKMQKVD
ncbi:hypothetical protein QBC34DRAFT_408659 [Podospora aff. communis PSN243]|uniref:Uncharacterized protein n=1 Tax=Podospora aff. communis PSN243 TaxID=3040156 RepID=A0AAV9GKV7_9PEZI|nr:hypothetical protein QBC34DRAFT_408659 [Podospora aff. communis PSN243]